MHTHFLC